MNALSDVTSVLMLSISCLTALIAVFLCSRVVSTALEVVKMARMPVSALLLPSEAPGTTDEDVEAGPTGLLRATPQDILEANRARELVYDNAAIGEEAERWG